MEKNILTKMLEVYQPEDCDWIGYQINKKNPLSYRIIEQSSLDNFTESIMPKNCKICLRVTKQNSRKKKLTVVEKFQNRQTLIKQIIDNKFQKSFEINKVALISKEGLEKLDKIAKISPELFEECMFMFQIINDMECPPILEIRKIMAVIQNRIESDLQNNVTSSLSL